MIRKLKSKILSGRLVSTKASQEMKFFNKHFKNQSGINRPFSYFIKESESNDLLMHFVEFSNLHNSDGSSNPTGSSLTYKNV